MIRLVRGNILSIGKDYLVIEIGGGGAIPSGIGVKVHAPAPTLAQHAVDSSILLHTYLQVREDALTLFGFESEDELEMFELLLGVSGVGPKVALSTLSTMTPDALRVALINEEPGLIARVPGIGKRTAEKIVLELKDKVRQPLGMLPALGNASNVDSEVIEALIALGYSVVEAQRAVQGLPKEAVGVEERLRLALSRFDR
ncbi:MAG: Holliday junction branch migration protein RuvA [Caldilineaceae bacterium]|nr:Holliday junction branch migration protein RuvA [Caldilineaceae bacterium]